MPGTFWSGALIALVIGFAVASYLDGQRLALKDQDVENAQSAEHVAVVERDEYKSAASGLDPVHLKATLDALQSTVSDLQTKVNGIGPRVLTADQIALIKMALVGTTGVTSIVHDMASSQTRTLKAQLAAVFGDSGWTVQNAEFMGREPSPKSGIRVTGVGPKAMAVERALTAAHISFDQADSPPPQPPGSVPTDVEIAITDPLP